MTAFLQVTILLLILGAAIAYIGNYVGRRIGKNRLTIFHLRPRHTAILITIISGILIALSTLAIILMVSQDARTALFDLEKLKNQISEKNRQLSRTNQSLEKLDWQLKAKLQQLKDKLRQQLELEKKLASAKQEIKVTRQGQVWFKVGEVVALSLIQGGPQRIKLEAGLNEVVAAAQNNLHSKVIISSEEADQALELLAENKTFIVKLIASRNVLWGEEVPARLEIAENKLVYLEGQEVAGNLIPKGLSVSQAEEEITRLLGRVHQAAREAGVLPGPTGSLGSVAYVQIFNLAKKISSSAKPVYLSALAQKDIYSIGPLEIKFFTPR
jgi:uncharacterized protein (DUF3084 family)